MQKKEKEIRKLDNSFSEELKNKIEEWERNNWFYAAILQRECLSYEHYIFEILEIIKE